MTALEPRPIRLTELTDCGGCAAKLGADEVKAVTARLQEIVGGRVELTTDVDPQILGGLVVRIGDQLIDGSVLGRLERLRNQLASGAL